MNIRSTRVSFAQLREMIRTHGKYLSESSTECFHDESFILSYDDKLVCAVPAFVSNGSACFHDGTSIVPIILSEDYFAEIGEQVSDWARHILSSSTVTSIKILLDAPFKDIFSDGYFSVEDNTRIYGFYDLCRERSDAWPLIRKSYHSLIHKGERSFITKRYINTTSIDREIEKFLCNSSKTTYQYDSERVNDFFKKVAHGQGVLAAYYYEEALVSVIGVCLWKKFREQGDFFYELGANDHSCAIPTHSCLYDTFQFLKSEHLGERVFLLHGVPQKRPECEVKLANIDKFKMGFCTDMFSRPYKVIHRGRV